MWQGYSPGFPYPAALPRGPFPNKISCFVSTCVSLDNSFPNIRQEPSFGPWKGSPFLQHNSHIHTWLNHSFDHRKIIALTRQTFIGKVMSLLVNMLPRLVRAFLPRSKRLLISWLQSPSAVIWGPPKNKACHFFCFHCFHCFPIYLPWSDGTGCHDLSFFNVEF